MDLGDINLDDLISMAGDVTRPELNAFRINVAVAGKQCVREPTPEESAELGGADLAVLVARARIAFGMKGEGWEKRYVDALLAIVGLAESWDDVVPLLPNKCNDAYQLLCTAHVTVPSDVRPMQEFFWSVTDRDDIVKLPAGERTKFQIAQDLAGPVFNPAGSTQPFGDIALLMKRDEVVEFPFAAQGQVVATRLELLQRAIAGHEFKTTPQLHLLLAHDMIASGDKSKTVQDLLDAAEQLIAVDTAENAADESSEEMLDARTLRTAAWAVLFILQDSLTPGAVRLQEQLRALLPQLEHLADLEVEAVPAGPLAAAERMLQAPYTDTRAAVMSLLA